MMTSKFFLVFMINVCFSTSLGRVARDTNGDLFVIELEVKYPVTCGGWKICNDQFMNRVYLTIESAPIEVSFRISFTNGITSNVPLVFESLNQIIVKNTTTTTGEN